MFLKKKKIDIYYYSDVGGRAENEDSLKVLKKGKDNYCFTVADGLGGHGGGALASKAAVETIGEEFQKGAIEQPESFYDSFKKANSRILSLQTRECQMKTTLVSLCLYGNNGFWAHIGDSRLYHFRDGKIVTQTFDHSVSQMAVIRGEIQQEEVRNHIDRNRLLRALGIKDDIKIDISKKVAMQGKQNAFLLCTDGFWEYVHEKEMEETLKASETAKEWGERMDRYLRQRITEGNDNNTAIAIIIKNR